MAKHFNIAGPCYPQMHYMVKSDRCTGDVNTLIEQGLYFVLHAARQTGKTTTLFELMDKINREGKFYALYCSLEAAERMTEAKEGIKAIVSIIKSALYFSQIPGGTDFATNANLDNTASVVYFELSNFCSRLDRPFIILFDEADCLKEDTLITFLRQLREGYINRGRIPFPHSIALVGMRNIRDYKDRIRGEEKTLGSASPFYIISKALTLTNFTEEEITALYRQHTDETGQIFEQDAIDLVREKTQGQPWLVNAIAREVVEEQLYNDHSIPVTSEMILTAINSILTRRDVHVDSIFERLKEPRVRKIVEPVIMGEDATFDWASDDYMYVLDLGVLRRTGTGKLEPANPIYSEMIGRYLSYSYQETLRLPKYPYQMSKYQKDDRIQMDLLMADFQQFWRENSEAWTGRYDYVEAAPHLIMMAFLQRIVNGGGLINREMALGNGRLDLDVIYNKIHYPVELKIRYGDKTYAEGLEQIAEYMDTLGCAKGWLVVFDRRKEVTWEDKIFLRTENMYGKDILIVGC